MVASLGTASPCCGWFPGVRIMLAEAPCQVATLLINIHNTLFIALRAVKNAYYFIFQSEVSIECRIEIACSVSVVNFYLFSHFLKEQKRARFSLALLTISYFLNYLNYNLDLIQFQSFL